MSLVVYRVQDDSGRGPWRPGFSKYWCEDREDLDNLIPWTVELPTVLLKRTAGMHMGCGCRTLEQLRRWFTPAEFKTLNQFGYASVQLEATRILGESDIQLVFERVLPLANCVVPVELYPMEVAR